MREKKEIRRQTKTERTALNLLGYLKAADKRKGTAPLMVLIRNIEKPLR